MAAFIQQLFLVAADLMFASALSCLLYVLGCLGVTGLVAYVVILSCRYGVVKNAMKNISQKKKAVLSTVSNSCVGQTSGKILGLAGFRGTAPRSSEWGPILKEEYSSNLDVRQLPAGKKKCQEATKTLTGSHLSRTGMSSGMKNQSGTIWEEEKETSQVDEPKVPAKWKNASMIPVFLLSFLFAPSNWCLKKRHLQRLASLLPTLKKSRD